MIATYKIDNSATGLTITGDNGIALYGGAGTGGTLTVDTSGNATIVLGDTGGATLLSVKDSSNVTALSVASDGTTTVTNLTNSGLTSDRVIFAGPGGLLSTGGLAWDSTNSYLGIANGSPSRPLTFNNATGEKICFNDQGGAQNFYGFGVGSGELQYRTPSSPGGSHRFYVGTTAVANIANGSMTFALGDAAGAFIFDVQDNASASKFSVGSSGDVTVPSLTSGRVTFAGAGGLLSDASTLTFSTGILTAPLFKTTTETPTQVLFVSGGNHIIGDAGMTYDSGTASLSVTNLLTDSIAPVVANGTIVHKSNGGISVQAGDATEGVKVRVVHASTTNATPKTLTFDAAAASASNIPSLAVSTTHAYTVTVTGRDTTNGVTAAFIVIKVVLERSAGGTVSLLDSGTENVYKSNIAIDASALADDTNKGLNIQVTGLAATNITWKAEVRETTI